MRDTLEEDSTFLVTNLRYLIKDIRSLEKKIIILPDFNNYLVADSIQSNCFVMLSNKEPLNKVYSYYKSNLKMADSKKKFEFFLSKISFILSKKNEIQDDFARDINFKFDITYDCNLSCKHCFIPEFENLKLLDVKQWKTVIKKINSKFNGPRHICISGGEPFLYNGLKEVIAYLKSYNHEITLLTNGVLFAEMIEKKHFSDLDFYLHNINFIHISVDGFSPIIMDKIRGKGSFNKIQKTINFFNEKINLALHSNVNELNRNDLEKNFINFIKQHSLFNDKTVFNFSLTREYGNARNMQLTKNMDFEMMLYNIALKVYNNFGVKRSEWFADLKQNCGIGSPITISPNGDLFLCGLPVNKKISNILTTNLSSIINYYLNVRKKSMQYNMKKCLECEVYFYCNGNCRIINKNKNDSYTMPYCNDDYKNSIYISMIRAREFGSTII